MQYCHTEPDDVDINDATDWNQDDFDSVVMDNHDYCDEPYLTGIAMEFRDDEWEDDEEKEPRGFE